MGERTLLWVCAVVLALGAGIGLGMGAYLYPERDYATQREETNQRSLGNAPPATVVSSNSAGQEKAPCQPGQDNRASDLCAQWKAADAAAASAYWDRFIAVLTGGGLLVGAATLGAAVAAAVFARRASNHAHRSADTANDALIADTRAWLAIKSVAVWSIGDPGPGDSETLSTQITIWVHNYGRGPSLDCELEVGWKRKGETWESVEYAPYCVRTQFDTLMPDEGNSNIVVKLHDPMAEVFLDGMLMLWVSVTYRIVGAGLRKQTAQTLKVGGPVGDGIQPVGVGYLSRGGKLAAIPVKTAMG